MTFLYTGAYTEPPLGRADGITVYRYDAVTGGLDPVQSVTGYANPTFLAASADGRCLYAVCEEASGAVAAFARDAGSGELAELNRQPSGGEGPAHVSVDASGRCVLVANYGSGSVAALPIRDDGSLGEPSSVVQHEGSGPNSNRQEGPHAHMIVPAPGGHVVAVDLGTDEVITYALDTASGQLQRKSAVAMAPGAGPRHIAFAPSGATAWVINELDSTITTCDHDPATGTLTARQTISAVPEGYDAETYTAHIVVSSDGRFVYGSNRGHDSIVTCEVDPATGELTAIDHTATGGNVPRHFALDPSETRLLVANQNGDNVRVMTRDAASGRLTIEQTLADIPSTVCLDFSGGAEAEGA